MGARRWEVGLIGLAIAVRVATVLVLQSHLVPNSTYEHGTIAANLLAGRGFSTKFLGAEGPTSQQAPLYPVMVAGAYWLGEVGTPRALLILQLGQAVIGGLLVMGVLSLGREIAPHRPWVSWSGALLAALYPTLVYATTHVQVASVATCTLVWTLALAYRSGRTRRVSDAILGGLALGLLALSDPILALVLPGMVWAVVLGSGWKRCLRPVAVICFVAALAVLPWIIRNYGVHHEFVAVKSSFGYAFWQGNCSLSQGTDKVVRESVDKILDRSTAGIRDWNRSLWEARHEAGYIDDIALTREDYLRLGSVSEPERSRILYRRAIQELRAEPGRYGRLSLKRLRAFLLFDETNPKTRSRVYRAAHLGLTTFSLIGIVFMPHKLRSRLVPTFLTAVLITLFHTLTIVSARFHIPIEPLMGFWGVAGLARLEVLSPTPHEVNRVRILDRRLGLARELSRSL